MSRTAFSATIRKSSYRRRAGLTLVELVVVVAIMALLLMILLPAVQSARESSRVVQCKNSLREIARSAIQYDSQQQQLPSLWSGSGRLPWQNYSWRAELLPLLDELAVYDRLDRDLPPLDNANLPAARHFVAVFQCPSTPSLQRTIETLGAGTDAIHDLRIAANDYNAVHDVAVVGREFPLRGIWNGGPELEYTDAGAPGVPVDRLSAALRQTDPQLSKVLDGLSRTILLIEQAGKPQGYGRGFAKIDVPPTEGSWITADYASYQAEGVNIANYTDPYGFHQHVNAALADGAVVSLHPKLTPAVLVALLSRDGNEIIGRADWE